MCGSKDTSGTGGSRNTLYAWRQVGFELRLWFEVAIIQRKNLASGSYICCQQFAGGNTLTYQYALQLPRCGAMIMRCRLCAHCGQVRYMKQRLCCVCWQRNAERKDNAQDGRDQVKKERGCTGCRFRSPCWEYGGLVCETWASMFMVIFRKCTNQI